MVIFKITLDPQIGSDPFFLSICAREEERKGASGAWELWRPVSLSFSIYNFRIFTTIPLLAWKLQRQASSVRKWCHSSYKDCSIFPNISRPCIHTKSKCQNFHIILYNTIKDRPPPPPRRPQPHLSKHNLSEKMHVSVRLWIKALFPPSVARKRQTTAQPPKSRPFNQL